MDRIESEYHETGTGASAPLLVDVPLLITTEETLKLLGGISRAGYHKMRTSGRFAPTAIKMGKRVLHRYQEVKDWVNAGCPPAARWKWG